MKGKRTEPWVLGLAILALISAMTIAAAPAPVPFYYAAGTLVEPQIADLLIGVNETVGNAVVSHDRKYVTMDMNPTLYGAEGMRTFTYQQGGLGFVGSATPAAKGLAAPAHRNPMMPSIAASPSDVVPHLSPLDKPGMTLVAPLGPA